MSMATVENLITEHFDLWTAALKRRSSAGRGSSGKIELYGIEKLRQLILELAVRGRLVAQDPNDEPASELIKKLPLEMDRLEIKEKKRGDTNKNSFSASNDKLPKGWVAIRASALFPSKSGNSKLIKGNLYANPEKGLFPGYSASGQDVWVDNWEHEGTAIILSAVGARCGKAFLAKGKWSAVANTHIIWVIPAITLPEFAMLHLDNEAYWTRSGGAQPFVKVGETLARDFPLPPLTEQHRIVAKVDALMVLCDQLEQQTDASLSAHQTLVETMLNALAGAADSAQFASAWQRIAEHFDSLFTSEKSIDQLKQTILQLAVMGKLVPQDPNDEPASELLKKIVADKAKLMKEGKIKKGTPLPPIRDDEKPFELSGGWEIKRLRDIALVFSGNAFKSEDFNEIGGTKVIKITNAGVYEFIETADFLPEKFQTEYSQFQVIEGDLILALTRPYVSDGLKISLCPASYHGALLNQRVAAIRCYLNNSFIYLFLKSGFVLNLYKRRFGNSGLQPNLKMGDVTELAIPIPPLAEQQRIVAKVDKLMTLCDQLKSRLNDAQITQLHLANALTEKVLARA